MNISGILEPNAPASRVAPARRGLQLLLLAAAMALGGYVRTALSPLQEAVRLTLSLTDNQMALLQGPVIGIPVMLAAVPLGLLIDRRSRVNLLRIVVSVSLAGTLFTAFASDFRLLLLARCVAGLMGASVLPIVFSLVADLYPPTQRGRVNSLVILGQVGGNSAAFALGGVFLALSGSAPDSWRGAMLWLLVPLIPVTLLLLALREPQRHEVTITNPSLRQVWHELRHYRAMIVPLVIGVVLMETALGAMLVWGAPMLSRNYSLSPDRVGGIMAIGMLLSGTVGPLAGGTLADFSYRSRGPRRTLLGLLALSVISVLVSLFAFVPGVAAASVLLVTCLTLTLATAVMGMTLFTVVIPNELRGLCMSLLTAVVLLFALAVAPLTVSLFAGTLGGLQMIGKALSITCMSLGVLTAVNFAIGSRYFPGEAVRENE